MRWFLALAEELHFGRASLNLNIAQSTLSRGIQQLERDLGAPLFERSTRKVRLTPAGEALVGPARDIVAAFMRAQEAVAATGTGESGVVTIAFAGAATHLMVGRLAKAVRETHPGIAVRLDSVGYAYSGLERVLAREAGLALGRWESLPADVDSRTVASEFLVIAINADHRLARKDSIRIAELRDEPWVTLPPYTGSVLSSELQRLVNSAGFVPNVVQIAPDTWNLISLVGGGIGCGLTVSSIAESVPHPDVAFVPLADHSDLPQLELVWRRDNASMALRVVLDVAQGVLPTPPAVRQVRE